MHFLGMYHRPFAISGVRTVATLNMTPMISLRCCSCLICTTGTTGRNTTGECFSRRGRTLPPHSTRYRTAFPACHRTAMASLWLVWPSMDTLPETRDGCVMSIRQGSRWLPRWARLSKNRQCASAKKKRRTWYYYTRE